MIASTSPETLKQMRQSQAVYQVQTSMARMTIETQGFITQEPGPHEMGEAQRYYLVPFGTRESFPGLANIVEIDLSVPVIYQVMRLPAHAELVPIAPKDMPVKERETFLTAVYPVLTCIDLEARYYGSFLLPIWVKNSLDNLEALKKSVPVNNIKRKRDYAVVVGNGPSLERCMSDIPEDADLFACWHASKKLLDNGKRIDYVCHVDLGNNGEGWACAEDFSDETALIATAQAFPGFVEMAQGRQLYGYFGPSCPTNAWLANYHKVGDHKVYQGSVAPMMINTAIYAGHTEIYLLGVDQAWQDEHYHPVSPAETVALVNDQGNQIKTHTGFLNSARGLCAAAAYHPEVCIYQASDIALNIPGIKYKPM